MGVWSAIVLTCQDKQSAQVYQHELCRRQKTGVFDDDVVCLTVEDPASGVGSGGATLNALLLVTEHLSAKQGYTVANADVLQGVNILIVHAGRRFLLDPCGSAFVAVPAQMSCDFPASLLTNLDLLLETMSQLPIDNPSGVWVCSTDMFLRLDHSLKLPAECDVCVLAVPGSLHYAKKHGVYHIDNKNELKNVFYQASEDVLNECIIPGTDTVPLVSGAMWLNVRFVERLLSMIMMSPLDACTYMGLDSGANPIKISLFFDLLLPLSSSVSESDFIIGSRSGPFGRPLAEGDGTTEVTRSLMLSARQLLWKTLHGCKATVGVVKGSHSYIDNKPSTHAQHLMSLPVVTKQLTLSNRVHSFLHPGADCDTNSTLINSRLVSGVKVEGHCVLSHCYIDQPVTIGKNSVLNGVWTIGLDAFPNTILPDSLVIQTLHINLPGLQGHKHIPVVTVCGVHDNLMTSLSDITTYCNIPWKTFLQRTGITVQDLWAHVSENEQTLENARLFPVLYPGGNVGWQEILWLCGAITSQETQHKWRSSWRLSLHELIQYTDIAAEFNWRKTQFYWISEQITMETLVNLGNTGLTRLYKAAVIDECTQQMLGTLDKVAMETSDPGVAARTLANIADLLGAMAKGKGGLRSGPASNQQWQEAFTQLETGNIRRGVDLLASVRTDWYDRPDLLVRAARHYEGAAQILIRHAVMTARKFIHTSALTTTVPIGSWVTVECPARIDISGGWSDCPPITYEQGGAVINAAITIDRKKPIGARLRRIEEKKILIHTGQGEGTSIVTLETLHDLHDYNQPHAPGALLKAAIICANIVQYPSQTNLCSQLSEKYQGGFEIQTWSNLPQGSGMGTSSILAGAVMAGLWTASSQHFDIVSLHHAVLHLEQMLTTGGGWQDQVGGLTGGVKVGHSPPGLPLKIDVTRPDISEKTVKDFNDRLLLVYTGRTRLARNLLQNVVRNWYARDEEMLRTVGDLVSNAWQCAKCFEKGDLSGIGQCIDTYWIQKKYMAPGCEPEAVTRMLTSLRPHVLGMTLAGAGGGGFMYVLTKKPNDMEAIKQTLGSIKDVGSVTVHSADVNNEGMSVTIEGQGQINIPYSMDQS